MKKCILALSLVCAVVPLANAGSYSGKEVVQQVPPPCEWYRANEWDFSFWGTIAFPWNTGDRHVLPRKGFLENAGGDPDMGAEEFDDGRTSEDTFINRDNAWGGGGDIKYFFSKYWGIGGEGFVLDCNDNIGGAGFFTVDFRFPIGCSRFAPYAWAGFGAISGGSSTHQFFVEPNNIDSHGNVNENENFVHRSINNAHTWAIGQFGAGLEVRITRHVGVTG